MSATIIAFPGLRSPNRGSSKTEVAEICSSTDSAAPRRAASFPADLAPISATALATKFVDHFLPVVQASVDLLEADNADFEDRCRRMLDTDGVAMIDELCAELQTVGGQMQLLVDGLDLTRTRLRTAMARLADQDVAGLEEAN